MRFILAFLTSTSAFAASSEIEYRGEGTFFHANKFTDAIALKDRLGPHEIKISNCNRTVVEAFWTDLTESVSSLQSSQPVKEKEPKLWVKYEGIKFRVLDFENSRKKFDDTPFQFGLLTARSSAKCK